MNTLRVVAHDGGWLASGDEAPIGYIGPDGAVMTPSGAVYRVQQDRGSVSLVASDGQVQAELRGTVLSDGKSGVEWRVLDAWTEGFRGGILDLDGAWALPYTLEDAQGTVPNRVKLLLAWILTRTVTESEGT